MLNILFGGGDGGGGFLIIYIDLSIFHFHCMSVSGFGVHPLFHDVRVALHSPYC